MSNHGIPIDVIPASPGFTFNRPSSRINIRPAPSLSDLAHIRVGVTFSLTPRGSAHRYNLSEGHLSFALYINADLSLTGTIYDSNGVWSGASSPPNTVSANTLHTAVLECDGVNVVRVSLDGR